MANVQSRWAMAVSVAMAASAVTGCSSDNGGALDLYAAQTASPADLAGMCSRWLGTDDQVSKRIGATVAFDLARAQGSGRCAYSSMSGDEFTVDFAADPAGDSSVIASGVGVSMVAFRLDSGSVPIDKLDGLSEWIDGRAAAVVDDHDAWLASLPQADPDTWLTLPYSDLMVLDGLDPQQLRQRDALGTMTVPNGTVTTYGTLESQVARVDGTLTRAPDGGAFVVVGLNGEDQGSSADVRLEFGADASLDVSWESLASADAEGSGSAWVAVAGSADRDVRAVVALDGVDQQIDVATGKLSDPGLSEEIARSAQSSVDASEAVAPRWFYIRDAGYFHKAGDIAQETESTRLYPFSRTIVTETAAWLESENWAPAEARWLRITLSPREMESTYPVHTLKLADDSEAGFGLSVDGTSSATLQEFERSPDSVTLLYSMPREVSEVSLVFTYEPSEQSLDAMARDISSRDTFAETWGNMEPGQMKWTIPVGG